MPSSTLAPALVPRWPAAERAAIAVALAALPAAAFWGVPAALELDATEPGTLLLAAPGLAHPLGTDHLGRDVLARLIAGAAPTLGLALLGLALTLVAGAATALVAGTRAGRLTAALPDSLAQALLSFPPMWIPLVVLAVGGRSVGAMAAALLLMIWPDVHWVLRGEVRRLAAEPFVESARALGFGAASVLAAEILPNLAGTLLWLALLKFRVAIVMLATLGFLGLGPPPPAPTWGGMIADARDWFTEAWWLLAAPAGAIALSLLAAALLARRVARALRRDGAMSV